MNEVPGFGAVRRREALRVPFELPTGLIGSGAQQDGLSQGAGVVEVAGGRTVRLAGQQPFLLVTDRLGDRGIGRGEGGELFPWQEHMSPVVGQQLTRAGGPGGHAQDHPGTRAPASQHQTDAAACAGHVRHQLAKHRYEDAWVLLEK